jgi:hypothetical protein
VKTQMPSLCIFGLVGLRVHLQPTQFVGPWVSLPPQVMPLSRHPCAHTALVGEVWDAHDSVPNDIAGRFANPTVRTKAGVACVCSFDILFLGDMSTNVG